MRCAIRERARDRWERFVEYIFDSSWTPGDNPIGDLVLWVFLGALFLAALPFLLLMRAAGRLVRVIRPDTADQMFPQRDRPSVAAGPAEDAATATYRGDEDSAMEAAGYMAAVWPLTFLIVWGLYALVDRGHHVHQLPLWTFLVFWFPAGLAYAVVASYALRAGLRFTRRHPERYSDGGASAMARPERIVSVVIVVVGVIAPTLFVLYFYSVI